MNTTKKCITCVFVFIILTLFQIKTFSQTNVSGMISSNTNWNLLGSPYIVTGNLMLDSGYVLTIDAGVIIRFNSQKSIQIDGVLRAMGTQSNPVVFTSNQTSPEPGDWNYILFTDKSQDYDYVMHTGSVMEYCVVEYAGNPDFCCNNGAIRITSSYPLINNCTVRFNNYTGITYFDPSSPSATGLLTISNCEIHDNCANTGFYKGAGGISINMNMDNARIINNRIHDNIAGADGGGISCNVANGTSTEIMGNIIFDNFSEFNGGGIIASPVSVVNNIIYNNRALMYGGAIYYTTCLSGLGISQNIMAGNQSSEGVVYLMYNYFWDSNSLFTKNTIIDNVAENNLIECWFPSGSEILRNTITRNRTIMNTGSSAICLHPGSLHNFNYNNIYGNLSEFSLKNFYSQGSANNIQAQNNWWGTSLSSEINDVLWDYFDESSLSVVYYTPAAVSPDTTAPVTPPVNVIKTDMGGGNIQISWNANPESDLSGYKVYYGTPTGYSFSSFIDAGNLTSIVLSGLSFTDTIAVTAYDTNTDGVNDQCEGHESWFTRAIGKPIVNFSADYTAICVGDIIHFSSETDDADSWSWYFEGGMPSVSSSENPVVIYNNPGVYYVKLIATNIAGTDSLTMLNYISVNGASQASLTYEVCDVSGYTSPSGLYIWYSSGVYQDTIINSLGCDSILTINLTMGNSSYHAFSQTSCLTYFSPSGNEWTTSGVYYDTIPNHSGCDSVLTIYLTVIDTDPGVSQSGTTLTSDAENVNYQWLDCDNMYAPITNEFYQSFTPILTGNYAVFVSSGSCADTSDCYEVVIVGNQLNESQISSSVFPNPASGFFDIVTVDYQNLLMVVNMQGEVMVTKRIAHGISRVDISDMNEGVYFVELRSENHFFRHLLIIQKE